MGSKLLGIVTTRYSIVTLSMFVRARIKHLQAKRIIAEMWISLKTGTHC